MKSAKSDLQQDVAFLQTLLEHSFLAAGRFLKERLEAGPDQFTQVVMHAGLSKRRAYALARIYRQFGQLGIETERLEKIGPTKLEIIGRFVEPDNLEDLLALAETHTGHEIASLMRFGKLESKWRSVLLRFSVPEYEVFEKIVVKYGAKKTGKGLFGKEAALMDALSMIAT